jgi:predicted nucleotidyltransferase
VTPLEAALRRIAGDLTAAGVKFALVGGLAVSARAEPRFTRDADLVVAVGDDAEAESLIRTLRGSGYGIEALIEQDAAGRLATARLVRSAEAGAPVIDLLFASSGIAPEVVDGAELIELLPGLEIRVANTGDLIALKMLSRDDEDRPQDVIDLRALLEVADEDSLQRARRSLELIVARGYNRGRSLLADWAALIHRP